MTIMSANDRALSDVKRLSTDCVPSRARDFGRAAKRGRQLEKYKTVLEMAVSHAKMVRILF